MINTIYTTTKVQCVTGVKSNNPHAGPSFFAISKGSEYRAAAAGSYTGNLGIPEVTGIFQL